MIYTIYSKKCTRCILLKLSEMTGRLLLSPVSWCSLVPSFCYISKSSEDSASGGGVVVEEP